MANIGFFSPEEDPPRVRRVLNNSNPAASLPPSNLFSYRQQAIGTASRINSPQADTSKRAAYGRQIVLIPSFTVHPQVANQRGQNQQPPPPNGEQTNRQFTRTPNPYRRKRKPSRLSPYEIRYQAAQTTTAILQNLGFTCALFGSMACKLYGNPRTPNDIDMLIIPPPHRAGITQEEIKALLVQNCPSDKHFVMVKSRDPAATYKVLYFIPKPRPADTSAPPSQPEEEEQQGEDQGAVEDGFAEAVGDLNIEEKGDKDGEGKRDAEDKSAQNESRPSFYRSCKVDVLLPGIMNLPSITAKLVTQQGGLPCVPFPLLLAQKLQGWAEHCATEEERFRKKIPDDVSDLKWCLGKGIERNWKPWERFGAAIWRDRRMFSQEFEQLTKERVKAICLEHPQLAAGWQHVGLAPSFQFSVHSSTGYPYS